jgi:hypothetical protein
VRQAVVATVLLLALAMSAAAWASPVDLATQQQMKDVLDSMGSADLEFVPTYAPSHYALETVHEAQQQFGVTFVSPKYPASSASYNLYAVYFTAQPFKGTMCSRGATATLKVNGKTVFWNGHDAAWQCLRAPSGQMVGVSAISAKLGKTELVRVAASVARLR